MRLFLLITLFILTSFAPALAEENKRYASIIVDADTYKVIHARNIDAQRFPASLTKVMTLYLVFDALNAGTLTLDEPLTVSKYAASTSPVKLGVKAGKTITVDEAIQAVAVRSANDIAVVLAERLGGTEENFAALMNAKAIELHMQGTQFKNPHGLPNPEQYTTARDMAKLASAVLTNHRRYYHYFGQTHFTYKGRTKKNTNNLLHWLHGVDGFKTGYTRASGYNLIISASRENRRIIAVVLGGSSGKARNAHMQDLVERGFDILGVTPVESLPLVTVNVTPVPRKKVPLLASTEAIRLRGSDKTTRTIMLGKQDIKIAAPSLDNAWAIQVGTFGTMEAATNHLAALFGMEHLTEDTAMVYPARNKRRALYQARFTKLSFDQADMSCKILANLAAGCNVIAPRRN